MIAMDDVAIRLMTAVALCLESSLTHISGNSDSSRVIVRKSFSKSFLTNGSAFTTKKISTDALMTFLKARERQREKEKDDLEKKKE